MPYQIEGKLCHLRGFALQNATSRCISQILLAFNVQMSGYEACGMTVKRRRRL